MENKSKNHTSEIANKTKSKKSQIKSLATILGIGGLNGSISIAALTGLFRFENAFLIAVLFMAGPGAILTALFFEGSMKERMLAALLAGLIATTIVVLAAGVGPKALAFFNLNILKIAGGMAILLIGLLIMGLKINENIPLGIIILGLIAGAIWR